MSHQQVNGDVYNESEAGKIVKNGKRFLERVLKKVNSLSPHPKSPLLEGEGPGERLKGN